MQNARLVRAVLYVALGFAGAVTSGCSEDDTTAPVAPRVDNVSAQSCDADPTVTGTAEFGATVRITGGSSEVTAIADPYTARFEATVPGGAAGSTLSVSAIDAAGNESEATVIDVAILAGSPAVIDLSLSENMVEAGTNVAYTTTVMDSCGNLLDDAVSISINAPGAIVGAGAISGLVRSGSWTVIAEVPGTPAADSETIVVDPDETTTVMVLQLASLSAFVGVPLGYTVTAVDGFGNSVDQASLDITTTDDAGGALVDPVTQTITFANSGTPSHTVTASLFAGTASEITDAEAVLVSNPDLAAPQVDILEPANGELVADRNIQIRVSATDDLGLAQIFLQATGVKNDFQQQLAPNNAGTGLPEVGPADYFFTLNVGGGTVGEVVLVAQAVDTSGNFTSSTPITITVDPARRLVFDSGRFDLATVSAGGFLDNPRGITFDTNVNRAYVANNNTNPVSVIEIDPTGPILANQNAFVLNQGVDGEDIQFFDDGAGSGFHFLSTAGNNDQVLRISARTAVNTGGGAVETFSSDNGQQSRGITVESASSIAVLFDDEFVRRYDPLTASGNLPVGASSSMDVSNQLGGSWGLQVLGFGCEAGQFPCADGTQCINTGNVCAADGNQCNDGSDEGAVCNGNLWTCADGVTDIDPGLICDGDIDCPVTLDFADEANCSHYAAADNGGNDEAFRFYDNGNGNQVANATLLADQPPLSNPKDVAVSPNTGLIYISNRDSDNLVQVDPVTLSRTVIVSGFDRSWGLVFEPSGALLITDEGDDIVYRLTGVGGEVL